MLTGQDRRPVAHCPPTANQHAAIGLASRCLVAPLQSAHLCDSRAELVYGEDGHDPSCPTPGRAARKRPRARWRRGRSPLSATRGSTVPLLLARRSPHPRGGELRGTASDARRAAGRRRRTDAGFGYHLRRKLLSSYRTCLKAHIVIHGPHVTSGAGHSLRAFPTRMQPAPDHGNICRGRAVAFRTFLRSTQTPDPMVGRHQHSRPISHESQAILSERPPSSSCPAILVAGVVPLFYIFFADEASYYAVEVATDSGLFCDKERRREFHDGVSSPNFFASWAAADVPPLPRTSGVWTPYQIPVEAWVLLASAPRLYFRVLISSSAYAWENVRYSVEDEHSNRAPFIDSPRSLGSYIVVP
jgi:hypothetical protein